MTNVARSDLLIRKHFKSSKHIFYMSSKRAVKKVEWEDEADEEVIIFEFQKHLKCFLEEKPVMCFLQEVVQVFFQDKFAFLLRIKPKKYFHFKFVTLTTEPCLSVRAN